MLRIGDASRILGVSVSTMRRMEQNGDLAKYGISVFYSPTRRRRYSENEIREALHRNAKLAVLAPADAAEGESVPAGPADA